MSRKKDYEVGYGKPPKHTRWKLGRSGNPRGRPKGSVDGRSLFMKVDNERVSIRMGSKIKIMTNQEAILRAIMNDAIRGKSGARREYLKLMERCGQFDSGPPEGTYGVLRVREPCEDLDEWARRTQAHYEWARKRYGPQAQGDAPRQGQRVVKVKRVRRKKKD